MLYVIDFGQMAFITYHSSVDYLESPKWNKQNLFFSFFFTFCFSHELMGAMLERGACAHAKDLFKHVCIDICMCVH